MHKIILALTFIFTATVHADLATKQDQITNLSGKIITAASRQSSEPVLDATIADLQSILNKLNGGDSSAGRDCLNYLLNRGYQLSTATSTCKQITTQGSLTCLSRLMDRGYQLSTATSSCAPVQDPNQAECIEFLLNRGYQLSTADSSCAKIDSGGRFGCLQDLLGKGYHLSTAVDTCSAL